MDHTQLAVDVMQSLALLLIGFVVLRQGRRRPRQTQTSGHGSTQVQSGGTVYLGKAALISDDLGRNGHRSTTLPNGHTLTCLAHGTALCICPKES